MIPEHKPNQNKIKPHQSYLIFINLVTELGLSKTTAREQSSQTVRGATVTPLPEQRHYVNKAQFHEGFSSGRCKWDGSIFKKVTKSENKVHLYLTADKVT